MLVLALGLFVLGAVSGSFVSALVWRVRQTELKTKTLKSKARISKLPTPDYSILRGRSMCPNCHHQLSAADLVPIFSWLALKGRCRYCHKKISIYYPLLELVAGVNFAASYHYWPASLHDPGQTLLLGGWLAVSVGLLALAAYDWRWRLLPNKLIYPVFGLAAVVRLAYLATYSSGFWADSAQWLASVAVAAGVFWLIYLLSKGRLIGFGDVRLGLVTGTVLASWRLAILMIFLASAVGSIVSLPALVNKNTGLKSRIAYGPYLIAGTAISLLFGNSIINWYTGLYK